MKNDIDEILDDIFSTNSASGKSKAAIEAEAFLASLNKNSEKIDKKLNRQLSEMEKINNNAKEQLVQMNEHLEIDGLNSKTATKPAEKKDQETVYKEVFEHAKTFVLGQDEFLRRLYLAFKRPFIMGCEEEKASDVIIINGKNGTGRHSALNLFVQKLGENGILKGTKPSLVDLSLYSTPDDRKIFIQDMFCAIQNENSLILFENYDKCHRSVLNNISDMVINGKIQLGTRYANQKGMMIDVGNALVKDAISSISCSEKYLVFITNDTKGKIADKLGSVFMDNVNDICTTGEFLAEDIEKIAGIKLAKLVEKSLDKLKFTIEHESDLNSHFAEKFTLTDGVNSIDDYLEKCFKSLSEYKLESDVQSETFKAELSENTLCFVANSTIKIEEVKQDNEAVQAVKEKMDEIIGLEEVKNYILALQDNYKMAKIRGAKGLKTQSVSMHMIFTGNAGTGKTTIARLVSRYLKASGVLTGGQLIEVSRADLVGKYVGHTAPLTKQIIESAIGGVLFIDEAYSLCRGEDDSFGMEAIDTLVKCMEDNRDNLVVILAGYTKEMEKFLLSNSGLRSRFPNIIEFPDYSAKELYEITQIIAKSKGYEIASEMEENLLAYYEKRQKNSAHLSGNGRMARNVLEDAILNQSQRIMASGDEDYEKLLIQDFEI